MKKLFTYTLIITFLISCNNDSKKGNMVVNGTIDGLKKGTVYLQKFKDTLLVSVDSVALNGESTFSLSDDIVSPELYFISLDKKRNEEISFFGEKGEITVTGKLEKFSTSAKIEGSSHHDLYSEHKAMMTKFSNKQLDLIKEKFEAQKKGDTAEVNKLQKEENNFLKRKIYYSVNFAVNNSDNEVAPLIALTELNYANIKLLDTVHISLSKKIKKSKYGIELENFIKRIKENEK